MVRAPACWRTVVRTHTHVSLTVTTTCLKFFLYHIRPIMAITLKRFSHNDIRYRLLLDTSDDSVTFQAMHEGWTNLLHFSRDTVVTTCQGEHVGHFGMRGTPHRWAFFDNNQIQHDLEVVTNSTSLQLSEQAVAIMWLENKLPV